MKTRHLIFLTTGLLFLSAALFSQKSIIFYGGVSKPNLLIVEKNHQNYQEKTSWRTQFGLQLLNKIDHKRRSLSLFYLDRKYKASSYSGGIAGGYGNDAYVRSSHLCVKGKFGKYLDDGNHCYIDFGGYLGIPLYRKIKYSYGGSLSIPGQPTTYTGGRTEDASKLINSVEAGLSANFGYEFTLMKRINLFIETVLNLAMHGQEEINTLLLDQGFVLGVSYPLND
ncbi:MAG: hypothetical protein DHS20C18_25480 [Saprospiraceae bacterium]|nr:MAG: hypothetical protein DHS20C18_25480 [Saprospiraceae bacterium]